MQTLKQYCEEFQGWPDWDDRDEISCIDDAVRAIKADKDFQRNHNWQSCYNSCDNNKLLDYLNDMEDLDDKEYLAASLGLTGMLSKDTAGFEFVDPITDKLSMYDDECGDENISITFCYDSWKYPKELENIGNIDKKRGYFYVNSEDIEQGTFDKRSHGKIPKIGLLWVMSTYSGTFPGYWCKDDEAKKDMIDYCGFIEFKKGNIVK